MEGTVLKVEGLSKNYPTRNGELSVLNQVSFELTSGSSCAIIGPSGSGKTTLLGLCAGLDRASSGSVILKGINLGQLSEDELARIRNQYIGFVFQNFNLIQSLTALENVMIPIELKGGNNARKIARELLAQVGLDDRQHHYPTQLSGGEQQRVSIARAFANEPLILFADEPTGNLDEETGTGIENLLFQLNREKGTTLVLVTHNPELASKTGQVLRMKGGRLVGSDSTKSTV